MLLRALRSLSEAEVSRTRLKRRVDTRLAWLGLNHRELADAIGVDKSCLTRTLQADRPRPHTLQRIATALGLEVEVLTNGHGPETLVVEHPLFPDGIETLASQEKISKIQDVLEGLEQ